MENIEQTQNKKLYTDSITKVYFRLDEPRKSVSFKCNLELWNTFKTEIKRNSLSICHVLEPMIFGWLEGKVHLSNTIKPLHIENLNIERAVKRVRRYSVEEEISESSEVCHFCRLDPKMRKNSGKVIGRGRYLQSDRTYPLCSFHAKELLGTNLWSMSKDE